MRILTLGGLVGPLLFTVVTIACAALRPDYSHTHQFISELGASGSANAGLMNYLGFVPTGLMLAAFGIALGQALPKRRSSTLGSRLIIVFGVGVVVAGVLSCDPGCPQTGGSLENFIHDKTAPLSFLSAIVGVGLLGFRFRGLSEWNRLWVYTVASSALALVFLVLLASTLETRELTGLWQRLLIGTLFVWFSVVGIHSYRRV